MGEEEVVGGPTGVTFGESGVDELETLEFSTFRRYGIREKKGGGRVSTVTT